MSCERTIQILVKCEYISMKFYFSFYVSVTSLAQRLWHLIWDSNLFLVCDLTLECCVLTCCKLSSKRSNESSSKKGSGWCTVSYRLKQKENIWSNNNKEWGKHAKWNFHGESKWKSK